MNNPLYIGDGDTLALDFSNSSEGQSPLSFDGESIIVSPKKLYCLTPSAYDSTMALVNAYKAQKERHRDYMREYRKRTG